MTQDPWSQPELPFEGGLPPSVNEFELKSLVGCAVLIAVGGCHTDMPTRFGSKAVVRGALVVLNGPEAGKEYIDVLFFNSRVVRTLRGVPGRAFIAHVDIDNSTTNPAVVLLDPSPEEYELARKWHADNPERTGELVQVMVSTFNQNQAQFGGGQQQQQRQQPAQTRSAPPSSPPQGPYAGRSQAGTSSSPPPSSPPPVKSATMASLKPAEFEPVPAEHVNADEQPGF